MPATRHAIFHTDASVMIGGGHVRRCLVLAEALTEAGWDITFVCGREAATVVPALARHGFTVMETDAFDAARQTPGFSCALLVIDDYRLDAAYESACRPWAKRILVIDDLANRRHDCDVLLDQSPGRQREDYASLVPADAELLLGPSYALLDRRFRQVRRERRQAGKIARIFVNFGTTDTANATQVALDAIEAAKLGAAIDIVLGSTAPHLPGIRAWLAARGIAASLHLDVDDMAALMQRADLAIGAGGVGSLERCCLGLPSLILTVADNQVVIAAGLASSGAAIYLGDIGGCSVKDIAGALQQLSADDDVPRAMSAAAAALVDGLGAARVRASCYPPLLAKDGRRVTLRQAVPADSARLHAWVAPGIGAPAHDEPERWLRARLDDPNCMVEIVLCGDEPVGVLRLDRAAADTFDASVLIAIDRQGLGIGDCVRELAQRLLPRVRMEVAGSRAVPAAGLA